MLRQDLQKVLNEYLIARKDSGKTSSPIARYITHDIREHIGNILDSNKYLWGSSAGIGNMAEIPWIDFGIKTDYANKNINVAYFFKADMSGVFLVLRAFYYGDLENKYQKELPNFLKTQAIHIRELIKTTDFKTDDLQKDEIDLATNSSTSKLHNSGIIYSKYYESERLPSEEELISDLKRFLELNEYAINNYVDRMFLTVDEWVEALENNDLISTKFLNVLEIIFNSKDYTSCYKDISKVREELGYPNEKDYSLDIGRNSQKIKNYFDKTELYDKNGKEEQWSRLFYGKYMKNPEMKSGKAYYFTLREELIEALKKYDKSKRNDRIVIDMPNKYIESQNDKPIKYWLISAGEGAEWWNDFYQNEDVGIGFSGTGDLNQYSSKDEITSKLQSLREVDISPTHDALACWQFVHDIKIGDVVFVKNGTSEIIGRGVIESDYIYDKSKPYHKLRKIKWTHKGNWKSQDKLPRKTLTDITNDPKLSNIKKIFEHEKYDSFYDYLKDNGYYFDRETIENYLLSLKVKHFVILTGNSGTGKTKLSQLFAQYLNQNDNYKIIPVGANWTENRHVLGYYDILNDKNHHTPAYELIKNSKNESYPHFLILDEMNLSHVERYFADFLSSIESNEKIPMAEEEEDLEIPSNLFIIGTVNVDETTYMFSPKVLDRANTIEFETYNAKKYMNNDCKPNRPKGRIKYLENVLENDNVIEMNINELKDFFNDEDFWNNLSDEIFKFQDILKKSGFDFGFRVINEIVRFMAVAYSYEKKSDNWKWKRYFDAQIKQKILPKLHGSEKVIGETLNELLEACEEYPTSQKKLKEMIEVLEKQRYVSFIN